MSCRDRSSEASGAARHDDTSGSAGEGGWGSGKSRPRRKATGGCAPRAAGPREAAQPQRARTYYRQHGGRCWGKREATRATRDECVRAPARGKDARAPRRHMRAVTSTSTDVASARHTGEAAEAPHAELQPRRTPYWGDTRRDARDDVRRGAGQLNRGDGSSRRDDLRRRRRKGGACLRVGRPRPEDSYVGVLNVRPLPRRNDARLEVLHRRGDHAAGYVLRDDSKVAVQARIIAQRNSNRDL